MCISDLSKNLMNDFPYNYIKQKFGNKAKLWFRETDRLVYKIETTDMYEDFYINKDMPDFNECQII